MNELGNFITNKKEPITINQIVEIAIILNVNPAMFLTIGQQPWVCMMCKNQTEMSLCKGCMEDPLSGLELK